MHKAAVFKKTRVCFIRTQRYCTSNHTVYDDIWNYFNLGNLRFRVCISLSWKGLVVIKILCAGSISCNLQIISHLWSGSEPDNGWIIHYNFGYSTRQRRGITIIYMLLFRSKTLLCTNGFVKKVFKSHSFEEWYHFFSLFFLETICFVPLCVSMRNDFRMTFTFRNRYFD